MVDFLSMGSYKQDLICFCGEITKWTDEGHQ